VRVSIHSTDNTIYIDGKAMRCDCADLREKHISAVQWDRDKGEIEYFGHKQPNEPIKSFELVSPFVDRAHPFPQPKAMTLEESKAHWEQYLRDHPELAESLENERIRLAEEQARMEAEQAKIGKKGSRTKKK
jgi:hypothetical protein